MTDKLILQFPLPVPPTVALPEAAQLSIGRKNLTTVDCSYHGAHKGVKLSQGLSGERNASVLTRSPFLSFSAVPSSACTAPARQSLAPHPVRLSGLAGPGPQPRPQPAPPAGHG
ncbi:hypothetical protein AAFF_G00166970 [Aldrovandia affinis]|uniref:Uncharacterized protein n=1 Tax=Aldrovandia affinis TaxID=143900 RepID=A0AAD7RME7_9TELE|nr:hypothetical protein AAFF_G00166970 [Aldrovandia affinis]